MKKLICFLCIAVLMSCCFFAEAEAVKSPDIQSLYKIDCDLIEKSNMAIGLEIVDIMEVNILWDAYDERDVIEAEVEFPFVPDDLAMVILTNGIYISQAAWVVTSDHSLHLYFYKEDLEPFIETEIAYIIMISYKDGLYFRIF